MVNPFREPGLEKYWVPSIASSALMGTRLMDDFFSVIPGGDIAFMNGILKALLEMDGFDDKFLSSHASGLEDLKIKLESQSWEALTLDSGLSRVDMQKFDRVECALGDKLHVASAARR